MSAMLDDRNAGAKADLLHGVDAATGDQWEVSVEQELSADGLFVARLRLPRLSGHATVEASGYRRAGGYEFFVSVFDGDGILWKGPSPFSYATHALYWARTWLTELG